MAIRRVKHGQFMLCNVCGELFLVLDLVGSAEVWHASDGGRLDLQLSVEPFEEATLGTVEFARDRNRLEVRAGGMVT